MPASSISGSYCSPHVAIASRVRQELYVLLRGTRKGIQNKLASPEFSVTYICIDLNREFQLSLGVHRQGNGQGRRQGGT